MGQAGEQPGLALFSDWLALCRFVYAAPPLVDQGLEALEEVGPAEGLTLYPLGMLAPADAERLRVLGPPVWDGGYPVAARFTPGGAAPSGWPPEIYTALLLALPEVVATRRAATITSIKADVDTPEGRLSLRYPAKGTEALSGRELAVEVVVEPVDSNMTPPDEGQGALRIVGPAATRLPQANTAARQALRWGHFRGVEVERPRPLVRRRNRRRPGPVARRPRGRPVGPRLARRRVVPGPRPPRRGRGWRPSRPRSSVRNGRGGA